MSKKIYFVLFVVLILPVFSIAQDDGWHSLSDYYFDDDFREESRYMVYEDQFDEPIYGRTYCESTGKLYLLKGKRTIVEYDIDAIKGGAKNNAKRTFTLGFNVETVTPQNVVEVSPDGKYLAFVDEHHENLHVIDISSGKEVGKVKLGRKFSNGGYEKEYSYKNVGCPFAFQSNNEILVAGSKVAMLFNIEKGRGKSLSIPHVKIGKDIEYIIITCVTPNGYLSGVNGKHADNYFTPYNETPLRYGYTFRVLNGKFVRLYENSFYGKMYKPYLLETFDDNEYLKYESGRLEESYNRRTGDPIDKYYNWSDPKYFYWSDPKGQYKFVSYGKYVFLNHAKEHDQGDLLLGTPDDSIRASWLTGRAGNGYFYLLKNKTIQFFNHNLTSDAFEKAILYEYISTCQFGKVEKFIARHPNSKYIKEARQKSADRIASLWKETSKPSDYSLAHFNDVKDFIKKYRNYGSVQAAEDELANIYKTWYERLGDIQSIDKYIKDFPASPYLSQAKEKQRLAYKPGYDKLCLEQSSKPYLDYVKNNPNSPYLEDVKARAKMLQQQEEAARVAERKRKEAEALAEKQRKEEEQRRQEEARIAEQKRKEAERERQIAANSKVSTWNLGNKLCNCQKNHIMVILDSWNENKTAFKGQVLASDVFYYDDAQLLQRDKMIWFETNGWHKCLEDEIDYCITHDRSHEISADGHIPPPASFTRLKRGDFVKYYHEWTESEGNWLFGYKDVKKSCLIFADVEDVNENCSRIKVKITSVGGSCSDSYYKGKTLWWDANEWEKVR